MTEFSDVIKQFKRMCLYYSRDKRRKSCPMCTSYPNCNIGECRKIAFERPAHFAATVMRWAAENPEPVYPTWREWLIKKGLIDFKPDFRSMTLLANSVIECLNEKAFEPIPADIAEKLGLEPKGES